MPVFLSDNERRYANNDIEGLSEAYMKKLRPSIRMKLRALQNELEMLVKNPEFTENVKAMLKDVEAEQIMERVELE